MPESGGNPCFRVSLGSVVAPPRREVMLPPETVANPEALRIPPYAALSCFRLPVDHVLFSFFSISTTKSLNSLALALLIVRNFTISTQDELFKIWSFKMVFASAGFPASI